MDRKLGVSFLLLLPLVFGAPAVADEDEPLAALSVDEAAARVRACYLRGAGADAEAVVAAHPDVYPQEEAGAVARLSCRYEQRGSNMGLAITVRRAEGCEGTFAVAFPPGSLGTPERTRWSDDDPDNQEVLLLRAPVVVLEDGQAEATIWVHGACANQELPGPQQGQRYAMTYVKPDSRTDRLAARLCSGAAPPPDAQGLVWAARSEDRQGLVAPHAPDDFPSTSRQMR